MQYDLSIVTHKFHQSFGCLYDDIPIICRIYMITTFVIFYRIS
ncbi:hypothetical protein RUMHYD_00032 [Blautia hydrogenotrophica DSM 10507]|uniref:Uncharacterized protein n=1 Tax=Blautia hydrogenotrophica (strain DSM 10507 / JCM 14656 / S5a33) TaxID=476272 RepID=C0CGR9_BLAHS|nr:hypothetical protein RUMHYD_00032 [Blautia hydrogenotrophica DSM 10507]